MPELPTGTVTFLFTDVEGSTRLLSELGDAYAETLAEHRRVLREAFDRQGGVEVDTQGDAFFVAFSSAAAAVAAAAGGQAALEHSGVRVRMGIHTGEPTLTEEGYVGMDVHRAARIAAAAHGGQVLLSDTTRGLAPGQVLRDLGRHRLKDLAEPVHLFQLGDGEFPPPRSLNATNLPLPTTPLVGRKKELADVLRLIRRDGARLVTATGPGGIGKTRFALEVASGLTEAFPDGVWFVDLAALRDPDLVLPAVAAALGAKNGLPGHIGDRAVLLLLDNAEQVSEAAPGLARLVESCSRLVLLVTSREPLHVAGEREYPLRTLAEAPAVELFRQRAEAARPDFEASFEQLAQVCRRLDCLPLALELAAARVKVLDAEGLLARLGQRLPLLTGRRRDLPERQRTLRATIEWSHELLSLEEQKLFRQLSVFSGGWTLEAAEEALEADLDALESLVEKSLVHREASRFSLLETIREFAHEQLERAGELRAVRARHAAYFAGMIERLEREAVFEHHADEWSTWGEAEHDNLRATLATLRESGDVVSELPAICGLIDFWLLRGHLTEARSRFDDVLSRTGESHPARLRGRALNGRARIAVRQADADRAVLLAEEALELARAAGDDGDVAWTLMTLATAAELADDNERAKRLYEDAGVSFRKLGDDKGVAIYLNNRGNLALIDGDHAYARVLFEEGVALHEGAGKRSGALVLNLGHCALLDGHPQEAARLYREVLARMQTVGNREGASYALEGLAATVEPALAAKLLGVAEAVREEIGAPLVAPEVRIHEGTVAALRASLGEAKVEALVAEGRGLELDEAVAAALGEPA